jgi:hypothetical protein
VQGEACDECRSSAISFSCGFWDGRANWLERQVGESYLIQAFADYRDCGSQMTYLIVKEVTFAMSTPRCVTLGF